MNNRFGEAFGIHATAAEFRYPVGEPTFIVRMGTGIRICQIGVVSAPIGDFHLVGQLMDVFHTIQNCFVPIFCIDGPGEGVVAIVEHHLARHFCIIDPSLLGSLDQLHVAAQLVSDHGDFVILKNHIENAGEGVGNICLFGRFGVRILIAVLALRIQYRCAGIVADADGVNLDFRVIRVDLLSGGNCPVNTVCPIAFIAVGHKHHIGGIVVTPLPQQFVSFFKSLSCIGAITGTRVAQGDPLFSDIGGPIGNDSAFLILEVHGRNLAVSIRFN